MMGLLEQHLAARHSEISANPSVGLDDFQKLADLTSLAAQHIPSLTEMASSTAKLSSTKKKEGLKQAASTGLASMRKAPDELSLADVEAAMAAWQQWQEQAAGEASSEAWVAEVEEAKGCLAEILNYQLTEAREVASEMCHSVTEMMMAISQAP